jgi:hypothetical protein
MKLNKETIRISSEILTGTDERGFECYLMEISYGPVPQLKDANFVQECMIETLQRYLGQVSKEVAEREWKGDQK